MSVPNWKGAKLEELELPSGNTVKINANLSRWNLAQAGLLDEKFSAILEYLSGESEGDMPPALAGLAVEYEARLVSMAVHEPKVLLDADVVEKRDDAVYIGELEESDMEAIVGAIFGTDADEFPADGEGAGNGEGGEVLADDPSGSDGDPKPEPSSGENEPNPSDQAVPSGG